MTYEQTNKQTNKQTNFVRWLSVVFAISTVLTLSSCTDLIVSDTTNESKETNILPSNAIYAFDNYSRTLEDVLLFSPQSRLSKSVKRVKEVQYYVGVDLSVVSKSSSPVRDTSMYVINYDGGGYMIASSDFRTTPIYAESASGSLDLENIPDNLKFYLEQLHNYYHWEIEQFEVRKSSLNSTELTFLKNKYANYKLSIADNIKNNLARSPEDGGVGGGGIGGGEGNPDNYYLSMDNSYVEIGSYGKLKMIINIKPVNN